ncbi:uncharacterized protein EAE97_011493 [Botrytis byssoidea]|uniref:Uncharacterized protein n=1 Tax=Botrytis byssoidea TaxID=139641 RepID=A0A9P5HRE2_9HELO|nr:uncharacterized protein EAE97_011493 [Botrytis byssoidea]KAF7920600.1 hypothetical protein EAE97_011493 [Botrytis byssoidea]
MEIKTQSSILLNTVSLGVTRGPVGKHQWDGMIGPSNSSATPTLPLTKLTLFLSSSILISPAPSNGCAYPSSSESASPFSSTPLSVS